MKHILGLGMMIALASASAPVPAIAQGGLGGLGGLLGGVVPDVGSVGASNAAGVLSYCVKNKLLGSVGGAKSVLGQLTKQPGVAELDGFKLGQAGTIKSDDTQLSLGSIKGKVKTQMCDLVLRHAKSFL